MSDFPVKCPVGTSLDTACAEAKQKEHEKRLERLRKNLVDQIEVLTTIYTEGVAACNGEASCLANAASQYASFVSAVVATYQEQKTEEENSYKRSLLDCCKEN